MPEYLECLDDHDNDQRHCSGPVEYRMALSASGKSFPRCDKHWGLWVVDPIFSDRAFFEIRPSWTFFIECRETRRSDGERIWDWTSFVQKKGYATVIKIDSKASLGDWYIKYIRNNEVMT